MGTMHFSSSKFVVSQSSADFKSGIQVTGDVNTNVNLDGIFVGDASGLNLDLVTSKGIKMFVGKSDGDNPPTFNEWVVGGGGLHDCLLTASSSGGHLNHYTFIENTNGEWNVVSSGSNNGTTLQDTYLAEDLSTGIHRYLVLGHSSSSKVTLIKGTTITINPELM